MEKFSFSKLFSSFFQLIPWVKSLSLGVRIALMVAAGWWVWNTFFVKQPQNINRPRVIVTPFAKVGEIDQTSTQVSFNEKAWEISVGGAVARYDNRDGVIFGGMIKRRF